MRVLSSAYGLRGDVEPIVGLAVRLRALGAEEVRVCVPPDFAELLAHVGAAELVAGWDPTTSHLIAAVELAGEPKWGLRRDALGIHSSSRMGVR